MTTLLSLLLLSGTDLASAATSDSCELDKGSDQKCTKCLSTPQCETAYGAGWYCCPFMKKCVNSGSMPCSTPIANCKPMCHGTGAQCQSQCSHADFPDSWVTCKVGGGTVGSGFVQSDASADILALHNIYRCMHGAPALEWEATVAASAQAWANNGVYKHSTGGPYGENLAWGSPSRSGTDSTKAWYNEVQFTKNGLASSFTDSTDPSKAIGHYTALVWNSTTKLGCGKGTATVNGNSGDFWVCQYDPPGNYVGQFNKNVFAKSRTEEECRSASGTVDAASDVGASFHSYAVAVVMQCACVLWTSLPHLF
eukprot:TRINITY_DN11540_c0_g1_i2.p1 TRINITY_DN11540_c0_g1~~TRINITY_DN11540_c0_g1_i2.p1  ORF type:complete len:342 (-),score=38.02 TRINITY_DN11540_c0_g1_i2:283-1212(-)